MAAKRESTFVNMLSTLLVITLVAAFTLGSVYNLTKEPIALAKQKKLEEAIRMVLPEFERLEAIKIKSDREEDSLQFFVAYQADTVIGVAINTFSNKGFSGEVRIMVSFAPDGTIYNTSVLDHKETPGLGDKMQKNKSDWSNQFNGMNPVSYRLKVVKDGGDVDAITAATISSRAFTDAVQHAYDTFLTYQKEN
ncbi:MAG: RnfABCDGE type electron transport complex subunit G [Bacteroidales bacterium]|jgi:electron transport complex protein RnfG|nr:RnfABCDGE type electron transport complex subunit G [Bacteroidales bacterium]MDD3700650.1 RnfABCDGE type electron transport complex subunit G [Bacteroidales bacterium]MDY0368227.1 RnfABCDGE type electron transport complex subunit G [Bacteroidales bacterium]